jgi:UDP-GlcNAc:undecaprenyl-phosphate/decaprenyl-phosphate GlcNAc-1-phosphate transferase
MTREVIIWAAFCWMSGVIVALVLTPLIRNLAFEYKLLDRARQFHTTHLNAVPRIGGLALVGSYLVLVSIICLADSKRIIAIPEEGLLILVSSLAAFGLGFWDDLKPLRAKTKLLVQILIALGVWYGGLRINHWINPLTQTGYDLGIWSAPITVLWLVGVTNLINLVDGIDGLAAGLILLLMILLSVVSALGILNGGGNVFSMLVSIGMAGTLLGFLFYNFPPAKIFMGDGGAYFHGMLIAELSLLNSNKGEVAGALIVPFFALGLPIIDSCFTIFRRTLVGLPIFRADRKHIHHRLAAMGFSQQRVVLSLYAFCTFFSLLALTYFVKEGRLLPVLFGVFMVVMLASARMFGFVRDWYKLGRLLTASMGRRKHTRYALLLGQVLFIEAENSKSVDELWNHFGFILQKLQFRTVTWSVGGQEHVWKCKNLGSKHVHERLLSQEIKGEPSSEIIISCSSDVWDEDTFKLLTELVAESWAKALTRRQELSKVVV